MNIKIHHRNLDLLKSHQKLIDRHSAKIGKMLSSFSPDALDLDIDVEKLPRGNQFQTGLVLSLPQRVIKVEEVEDNPSTSLVRAFSELRRRVKKFKSQLNRERLWHKQPATSETASGPGWSTKKEAEDHLEKVESYVRREIYHHVVGGQIPPGLIEPQAIVDELFLKVTSSPAAKPSNLSVEQWMFQNARSIVRSRMQEIEAHRGEPHIEEEVHPRDAWEDEALNFFQPDESLHLEDLTRDGSSSTPEELLAREEVEDQLQRVVANLPETIRESFVLFAIEGFTSDEVAMITGKAPKQVLEDVEDARQRLRRELSS